MESMFNRLRMLAANAAPHLQDDESVRATVIGRVNSSPSGFDFSSLEAATNDVAADDPLGEFGAAHDPNYAVMATQRNLYVFRLRARSFTKFAELTTKHQIGTVDVVLAKGSGRLLIGSLFMGTAFQRARARRVLAAVGGAEIDEEAFEQRRIALAEAHRPE